MYRIETRKQIHDALSHIVAQELGLPKLWSSDPRELAENVDLLSKLVADQLWVDGYELELRPTLPTTINAPEYA